MRYLRTGAFGLLLLVSGYSYSINTPVEAFDSSIEINDIATSTIVSPDACPTGGGSALCADWAYNVCAVITGLGYCPGGSVYTNLLNYCLAECGNG